MNNYQKKFKLVCCGFYKDGEVPENLLDIKGTFAINVTEDTFFQHFQAKILKKTKKNCFKNEAFYNYANKQIELWKEYGVYEVAAEGRWSDGLHTDELFEEEGQVVKVVMQWAELIEGEPEPHFCRGKCGIHPKGTFDGF